MPIFDSLVLGVKLLAAWTGICYARQIFHLDSLIIEGDSATIISWIMQAPSSMSTHPIIRDIDFLLRGCAFTFVRHIYRKANSTMDWITSFGTYHAGLVL